MKWRMSTALLIACLFLTSGCKEDIQEVDLVLKAGLTIKRAQSFDGSWGNARTTSCAIIAYLSSDEIRKGQGVVGVGQSGFSQFSTSPLKRSWFTRVGPLSLDVYLWSYGDGGQFHTFGDRRTPNMYGQGWEVVP